jgi:hypothetical protein
MGRLGSGERRGWEGIGRRVKEYRRWVFVFLWSSKDTLAMLKNINSL